ncbi:MAG: PAS domain S-box protein [Desulfobacterales bacterium]|nr:PAS domain S-box protein [Desulfobacterales bacterium]
MTGAVEFFRNITDRRRTEEALKESEEKFRAFVEGADDLITRVDGRGRFLYVNSRAKKYLGLDPTECPGKSCFDFVHPDDRENTRTEFHRWMAQKAAGATLKNRQINKTTGEVHHLLWTVNLHYDEAGEPTFINSLARDLTEREHTDEQLKILVKDLEMVNKELQHFAYVVSHDLKAPLRGIISVANWLYEDYTDVLDEDGRGYLDKLITRARRMHNLIEGVLEYSRVGRVEAKPQRLDSDAAVRKVIDAVSPPGNIRVRIERSLPTVVYDKILLEQLFQNLISNAIRHLGKPEGEVVISCGDNGAFWEFCVRDDGVGIEERHFDKIFKIFQSLKPSSDMESSGIGLSLVKKIAERNGGAVRVESTVNEGSAFFFTMPKKQEPEKAATDYTVLIIDDDKGFTEVASAILELKGCHVLHAANARIARKILKSHPGEIHASLFDVIIPDEDPFERYEILRKLRPEMKIIVCTGRSVSGIVEELVRKGVDGVLKKPFRIDELSELINPGAMKRVDTRT